MTNVLELQDDTKIRTITIISNDRVEMTLFAKDFTRIRINDAPSFHLLPDLKSIYDLRLSLDTSDFQLKINSKRSCSPALMSNFSITHIPNKAVTVIIECENNQSYTYDVSKLFKFASISLNSSVLSIAMSNQY